MRYILDANEMKEIDRYSIEEKHIPSIVLMERAALMVTSAIVENREYADKNFVVLCGCGNNAADGIAVARMLNEKNLKASVYRIDSESRTSNEFDIQLLIAHELGIDITDKLIFDNDTVFIDAIFGIGLSRNIEGKYKEVIDLINDTHNKVISVDIPSGINSTTGEVMGTAVKADMTVTFGYFKTGHILYPGSAYCGNVKVYNIGFAKDAVNQLKSPKFTLDMSDVKKIPDRNPDGNKGTFGKVLIVAGSENIGGAAVLSAIAAYRTGCGMVKVFTHINNKNLIMMQVPEALVATYEDSVNWTSLKEAMDFADSIVLGPGIGTDPLAKSIVGFVMENSSKPVVIDADAITIIARNRELLKKVKDNYIFTPHLKEMERLTDVAVADIKKDIVDVCRLFAVTNKCICILKDSRTVVAKSSQKVYINTVGNSGMATAGSGDVLTGIIASFLAMHYDAFNAACLGVLVHGLAGDYAREELSEFSMTAKDIAENIYKIYREKSK